MIRVRFERTGGFAGLRTSATIDSDSLTPEDERDLDRMIEAAGFFELPGEITPPAHVRDQFVYRITVEKEGRRHTVVVDEAAAPATLRPLIGSLTSAARKAERRDGPS